MTMDAIRVMSSPGIACCDWVCRCDVSTGLNSYIANLVIMSLLFYSATMVWI